ncbi:MAG: hypothetical protein GVY16_06000 [Planctomycetes bacterium]|jgi:hypothetical protein|nr:hypothetical protein [Phycisphaerae bacterium]NBB95275.1 hypothetical protein [Planctomycetota bacterium]
MLETMANISILAASEDIANVIFAVVVAIFAIIGAVAKKNKKQQGEVEAQARREAARRRRLEQAVQDKQDDDDDGWIVLDNDESTPPPPPPQRIGGDREPKPLRPPAPVIEGRQDIQRARAEVRRAEARARSAQADAARAKAHATQQKQSASPSQTPHMTARPNLASKSKAATTSDSEIGIRVNLTRAPTARNAVILHEILGPPKARQENPDPWQSA